MDTITFEEPVNIHEAKTHFSKIISAVEKGQTVVISRYGKPVAKLEPIQPGTPTGKRRLGALDGLYNIPDDIDSFMEDEVNEMFYGETGSEKS